MSVPISAGVGRERDPHLSGSAERMCQEAAWAEADRAPSMTSIFPPRDADAGTRAAWLARSPWPEIVFACAQ